jgi:hypothetical protein
MATTGRRRARRGTGSITPRGKRFIARVDLGLDADGKRIRRNRTFSTKREAQAWIEQQHSHSEDLILPVADQRLDEYDPPWVWWLEHEAPKGRTGRAPLAWLKHRGTSNPDHAPTHASNDKALQLGCG